MALDHGQIGLVIVVEVGVVGCFGVDVGVATSRCLAPVLGYFASTEVLKRISRFDLSIEDASTLFIEG